MLTPRTTMTYAKWLDHVQREKEARAAAVAAKAPHSDLAVQFAEESQVIAGMAAEAAVNRSDDTSATLELPVDPDEEELCTPNLSQPPRKSPTPPTFPPSSTSTPAPSFSIGDIDITPFTIPHDAADPCGFVFESEGIRMAARHRPRLHATQRQGRAQAHRRPPARIQPRPRDAPRRPLSLVASSSASSPASATSPTTPPPSSSSRTTTAAQPGSSSAISPSPTTSPNSPASPPNRPLGNHPTLLGNRILLADQAAPLDPITL